MKSVGPLEDVLGDFLYDRLREVGELLGKDKTEVPLDVLSKLVTSDGTKQILGIPTLIEELDHKGISEQDITFCIEEFEKRKLLKRLEV